MKKIFIITISILFNLQSVTAQFNDNNYTNMLEFGISINNELPRGKPRGISFFSKSCGGYICLG
ncbi:hypothetical protein FACS189494_05540 [Spirochaetia bacterium]|nr:hypothetical protein FACS189494_05540 [Spirochaetia bacterium]